MADEAAAAKQRGSGVEAPSPTAAVGLKGLMAAEAAAKRSSQSSGLKDLMSAEAARKRTSQETGEPDEEEELQRQYEKSLGVRGDQEEEPSEASAEEEEELNEKLKQPVAKKLIKTPEIVQPDDEDEFEVLYLEIAKRVFY